MTWGRNRRLGDDMGTSGMTWGLHENAMGMMCMTQGRDAILNVVPVSSPLCTNEGRHVIPISPPCHPRCLTLGTTTAPHKAYWLPCLFFATIDIA